MLLKLVFYNLLIQLPERIEWYFKQLILVLLFDKIMLIVLYPPKFAKYINVFPGPQSLLTVERSETVNSLLLENQLFYPSAQTKLSKVDCTVDPILW